MRKSNGILVILDGSSCGKHYIDEHLTFEYHIVLKAAQSVTFDPLVLELMFLFIKNTVKKNEL